MWKTSIRGYLMSRPQIKKLFWSIVFSYPNQQQWTISWSDCDMRQKVEFIQLEMTSSVFRPRRSSKALRKDPNLHQKKRSWSLFCGLLMVWSTTAFWIPVKPLHLRSMLSKSVRCTENCNTWVCHWLTERAQFFSTMADCMSHKQCFKSWMNWATKFYLLHHIHLTSCQLTTTSSIWTTFCRENASTTNRTQKMLSKSSLNPKAWIFML